MYNTIKRKLPIKLFKEYPDLSSLKKQRTDRQKRERGKKKLTL